MPSFISSHLLHRIGHFFGLLALSSWLLFSGAASAQGYPDRPIRLYVGTPGVSNELAQNAALVKSMGIRAE